MGQKIVYFGPFSGVLPYIPLCKISIFMGVWLVHTDEFFQYVDIFVVCFVLSINTYNLINVSLILKDLKSNPAQNA